MTHLALCCGYDGSGLALGTAPDWYSEIDAAALKVLAVRRPDAENLGDLTTRTTWPHANVVSAGFPCQAASHAGRRKGTDDDRWLWPDIARVLRAVRPHTVYLENVPGLLTVNGGRAYAEILHDLAVLGFDAEWGVVRASDIGACHRRARWWCVARDATHVGRERDGGAWGGGLGPASAGPSPAGVIVVDELLPTPTVADSRNGRNATAGRSTTEGVHLGFTLSDIAYGNLWDRYGPAIARHEHLVGRPAPAPVIANPKAKRGVSLSPVFVEWMMGLPEGWVTDVDLPRTAMLRVLGNGQVPAQARAAWAMLAAHHEAAA